MCIRDSSQIEPRLALHYCAGEVANELKELFQKKPESDFYAILMTSAPDVERQVMKMVLLAQLYGQGEASLSLKLGDAITGKRILDGFNNNFPFFRALANQVSSTARRRKYIRTVGQRRCNYNGADSTTLHKAPNRLIQGGAADIMKKAIVDLWEGGWCAEDKLGAPIAVVHDELIFSTKMVGDDLKLALKGLEDTMVNAYPLTCPLHAESNTGNSWWDIH
jgi:DNA polymerase I-like protein with 3'-5' exonuclease and polymerase domains